MRICCAISGFSSMLSLTMRTAPLAARTIFSSIGPNCLQGPHHGAQKSTMIGWSNEASTTSAMKFAVVTSATGAAAGPPPIKDSFVMPSSPRGMHCKTWRQRRAMTSAAATWTLWTERVEIDDAQPLTARGDEAQEIGGGDRRRTVVFERMVIEGLMLEHRPVEHDGDKLGGI